MTTADTLLPGLPDPVIDSQRVFRVVLDAMARPGTLVDLPLSLKVPAPLDPATAAVALALADVDTRLWLDGAVGADAVRAYLRFHCGCPLTEGPAAADFAIVVDPQAMPPLAAFNAGSDEFPDSSTTVIVQVPTLDGGEPWTFTGPGIRDRVRLAVAGLPPAFRGWVAENHAGFPRGVDLIFTSGTRLAALPRSARLEG
ncbi:phosphonate C-P lyase system protein PhnH [Azospirillum canadense]|uniref:phosphonate C-P lyase system protein PhnH n=1 Tax=Azospirillum canadense TaxID=403962 RepID=UPI002226F227|nr:phosphonate C-P lyase system protein PhnH [Azospirillum canadense]MCW2239975.1 alpha-D-ribose 1-methylphosphonate 5-triphosphate synthase subunit PhnH [Azospirillum canadense]